MALIYAASDHKLLKAGAPIYNLHIDRRGWDYDTHPRFHHLDNLTSVIYEELAAIDTALAAATTLYSGNGSLASVRTVTMADKNLTFSATTGRFTVNATSGTDVGLIIADSGVVSLSSLDVAGALGSLISVNPTGLINLQAGTAVNILSSKTGVPGVLRFLEDPNVGTNYVEVKSPTSVASNVSYTLPGVDGTIGQVMQTDGAGVLSFSSKTVNDNFAIADLTATGARSHNFESNNLLIDNIGDLTLNAETEVLITANNNAYHSLRGFTSTTQNSWFFRANDGTDSVTIQLIADSAGSGGSQIELGTGATGAPILFDTDGYVQVDGQAAQSGEFRIEALSGGHYMAQKVDTNLTGAAFYTLTWPNAGPAADDVIMLDASGNVTFEKNIECIVVAISDETTALTVGTAKTTFRMPYAFVLTEVRASLTTAGTTAGTTKFDINQAGTTILSTKLTIDFGEKTSTTAATAAVISDTTLDNDIEITIDVDTPLSTGATEAGGKIYLIGYRDR